MSSSTYEPPSIVSSNISDAWRKTFLRVFDHPGKEISPFVVTLLPESGTPFEISRIRDTLDRFRAYTDGVAKSDLAETRLVAPFFRTVVGTDTYVDQLW